MSKYEMTAEQIMNTFMEEYARNKDFVSHFAPVSAWLVFVIRGIEKIKDEWKYWHERQLKFVMVLSRSWLELKVA
jgi:hypothetical protein